MSEKRSIVEGNGQHAGLLLSPSKKSKLSPDSVVMITPLPNAMVSEMDAWQAGGDAATPGTPIDASAMSVDEVWGLKEGEVSPWARNRDTILAQIERKLKKHKNSAVAYLEAKYAGVEAKEKYARALWQELPPIDHDPPLLAGNLPGKPMGSLTGKDVCVCVSCTWLGSPSCERTGYASQLLTRS